MNGRHVIRNAPGLAAAVLAACAATGAAAPGNFDTMTRDARAVFASLKENASRDTKPIRAVTVPGAVRAEWVSPDRKLNALPAGAMLLAKQDISFPSGYPRIVFHHGEILTGAEAWKITDDEPAYGDSFCMIDMRRNKGPQDPQFLLRVGDGIVLKGETDDSRYAPGYTLAVESPLINEFGCYVIAGTKEAKEYATVGLMREHLRGIFNFAW